jgi:hypothetical protein
MVRDGFAWRYVRYDKPGKFTAAESEVRVNSRPRNSLDFVSALPHAGAPVFVLSGKGRRMPITFSCPKCGRQIRVRDDAAGQSGKCNDCGAAICVPKPQETQILRPRKSAPPAIPDDEFLQVGPPQNPVAVQVNVQQPSKAAHSLGIASTVLGILAFLICWIPFVGVLGMPLSGLGLLLGVIGIILAVVRRGSGIGFSIAGSAICGLALLVAFTVTSAIVKAVDSVAQSARSTSVASDGFVPNSADQWQAASDVAQNDLVRVHVASARVGNVALKSFAGESESQDKLLQITLQIDNLSHTKKLDYRGWSGGMFGITGAGTLEDDAGNRYKRIGFGGTKVVGQQESESIYPSKSLSDVLVFEAPTDSAKTLRLTLPCSAYGGTGDLRITTPTSSIRK